MPRLPVGSPRDGKRLIVTRSASPRRLAPRDGGLTLGVTGERREGGLLLLDAGGEIRDEGVAGRDRGLGGSPALLGPAVGRLAKQRGAPPEQRLELVPQEPEVARVSADEIAQDLVGRCVLGHVVLAFLPGECLHDIIQ
jgi:hypothetical protein